MINRRFTRTKKNGGVIPAIKDGRTKFVPIGCGKCIECRKQKARGWQVRLSEEIRENKNGKFVTMTFSDKELYKLEKDVLKKNKKAKGYDLENEVAKLAVKRFLERWRWKYKKSVKHWLVTELGHVSTERIHLHGIIWTDEDNKEIEEKWKYGTVWVGEYVNEKTINYIVKYITKIDKDHENYNPKVLNSKGIGIGYMNRGDWKNNKYKAGKTKETYITRQGTRINLPIYYRNKIYTEEQREKLWIEKLNKKEMWVDGVRIDISNEKGVQIYDKANEEARKKNKRLGYGNNTKSWDEIIYENEKRDILREKREEKIRSRE